MTKTIKKIKVFNMTSPNGNDVPNQFEIITPEGIYFQSYETIIAFTDNKTGKTYLDENAWDYSNTTKKYLNQFLENDSIQETRAKIKSGEYILTNLNV